MSWVTPTDVIYRYFLRMKKLFPLNSKFKCFSLLIFFGVCFVIRRTSRFEWTTLVFVRRKWKGQWLSQKSVFFTIVQFLNELFFSLCDSVKALSLSTFITTFIGYFAYHAFICVLNSLIAISSRWKFSFRVLRRSKRRRRKKNTWKPIWNATVEF